MAGMERVESVGQQLRACGRLLLVPALLIWPVFLFGFGSAAGQMVGLALAVLPLALGLLLGAWRGPGRWWAVLAVALWVAMLALRPDARLWLWRNEADLVRVVAAAHARGPSLRREVVEGYVVSTIGTTVLVHCGSMIDHGIAHDPGQELRAGGDGALRLSSVRPLWGPWRMWQKDD